MKVTVIGSGYVGLVTAACLADMGNNVFCLDIDAAKVAMLRDGRMPIHEPGLADVVQSNAAAGRLHFDTDTHAAALHGKVQFIAVGTPPDSDGSADLQYVLAAARELGRHMDGYRVVVDKSTVPVGTARAVRAAIAEELRTRGVDHRFAVVSNPEFLKEGAAVEDFMRPGPHRHRQRRRRRHRRAAPAVRAVRAQSLQVHGDGRRFRGTHQVRRQRDAGDAH